MGGGQQGTFVVAVVRQHGSLEGGGEGREREGVWRKEGREWERREEKGGRGREEEGRGGSGREGREREEREEQGDGLYAKFTILSATTHHFPFDLCLVGF